LLRCALCRRPAGLPAFPTRRSADLDRQLIFDNLKQPELTIAKVDAADSTTPIPGTVFRIEAIDGDYQHDVTTGQDGTVTLRVQPDRKSTRLNSSHVSISYAVFCWKD